MLMLSALPTSTAPALADWLRGLGLTVVHHQHDNALPGSYWGAPEAGVCGDAVHVRDDTPLHSLLHEACHIVCARAAGRRSFERDAGGGDVEELAVCLLQLLVAEQLPEVGWRRIARDMDAWGYRFVAGSAAAWYRRDSGDARAWLDRHAVPTGGAP